LNQSSVLLKLVSTAAWELILHEDECQKELRQDFVWFGGFISNQKALIHQHHLPSTATVTEILWALYSKYGKDMAPLIEGTLAYVICDHYHKTLLVVSDRTGQNELYYAQVSNSLLLSNQLESLINEQPALKQLDYSALVGHVNAQVPPSGQTFYKHISKLPAGFTLLVNELHISRDQYWDISNKAVIRYSSDEEYAAAFCNLLFQIVNEYCQANSTAAITLSSGLDSTSLALAMKESNRSRKVVAFCWSTPDLPAADELQYSTATCKRLDIPQVAIRADRHWPFSGNIAIGPSRPHFGFYKELWDATFESVKHFSINLLITGGSGDHLFGGNVSGYPDLLLTGRWLELYHQIKQHLPNSPNQLTLIQILYRLLLKPIAAAYWPVSRNRKPVSWLAKSQRKLFNAYFSHTDQGFGFLPGRWHRLQNLRDPNLNVILAQLNKQAAEYGISLLHPFVDHRLIEFALALPTDQTFRAAQRKIIMRNALRNYVPNEIVNRYDKIYLGTLAEKGLRFQETKKIWSLLTKMRLAELGIVNEADIRQAYQDYLSRKTDNVLFWYTVVLEDWLRHYW
jgi:asparagine synthase (glutamine-hydrolysing)